MKNKTVKRGLAVLLCALTLLSCMGVFAIAAEKKSLKQCSVTVASPVAYNGKARKAAVTVKDGKTVLKNGADYTLTYKNNKNIGTATVTVTAKKGSAYTGAKTVKFKIVPAKVKNLTAAKTTQTAVKLTWSVVKGAAGYAVYTYDKATKTYTRVKTSTKAAATVKNLAAGTRYVFAVRAYAKVKGKNIWGAYSAQLKVKTKAAISPKAYRMDKYKKLFDSGTYQITFTTNDPSLGKTPITFATKNGNIAIDTKLQSFNVRMIYQAKNKKTYILLKDIKKYTELTEDIMGEDMDLSSMMNGLVRGADELTASTVKVNGKTYVCESTTLADGSELRYLFKGDELVQIDTIEPDGTTTSTYISKISGDVDDSLFKIPKGYGYMNLSWLAA